VSGAITNGNLALVPEPLFKQQHYSIAELSEKWDLCPNTIRRWFEDEPDVLKISVGYRRGKSHRVTLRIPEAVAERVHRERCRSKV